MHTYTIKRRYDSAKGQWLFWIEDETGQRIGIETTSFQQARQNQLYLQRACPGLERRPS